MKAQTLLFIGMTACILLCSTCQQDKAWINLLDKDLSHWEIYQSYEHHNDYNGKIPLDSSGKEIQPIGYHKNLKHVFKVITENGEPVLRISGETYGCLYTRESYENYHLQLMVRWGNLKWEPRLQKLRDSGILYHSIGPCAVEYWRTWMMSQEFQVMEGHMGDFWTQATSAIDIRSFIPEGNMNAVASDKQPFIAFGGKSMNGGYCMRSADYESPRGEWTRLDLICFQGKSLHIVNGKVVMILQNSRYEQNGKVLPLVSGRIQIQSEAAEVFYKNIRIKKISSLPEGFEHYFQEEAH